MVRSPVPKTPIYHAMPEDSAMKGYCGEEKKLEFRKEGRNKQLGHKNVPSTIRHPKALGQCEHTQEAYVPG